VTGLSTGLSRDGIGHRVIAKVSRPEVAEHFLRPAHSYGLRGIAELPTKSVWRSEPDMARRCQRLCERFQNPRLSEIRRPRMNVSLCGEPCRQERVRFCGVGAEALKR